MRASAAHVAYRYPAQHRELTRHLRDTTPATIIRVESVNGTGSSGVASEIVWSRSAADQLADLQGGDDWKRYVPIIGAKPGYIPFTQPERAAISSRARMERLTLQCDLGARPSAATALALPPPSD